MIFLDIALMILSIVGLLLLIWGFQKSKQSYTLVGGLAFLASIFYLIGWNLLLPMAPPIALAISYFAKKKEELA